MTITFNDIPTTTRTPGVYNEIDNSRALKGLVQNPHKVLILGQKLAAGSAGMEELKAITRNDMGDTFFGTGSILARMCNKFKENNPNTELHAMALSVTGGTAATGSMFFSDCLDGNTASGTGTFYMMINGTEYKYNYASGDSGQHIASHYTSAINSDQNCPVKVSNIDGSLYFTAKNSGTVGNHINIRFNYYVGQEVPGTLSGVGLVSALMSQLTSMNAGATDPDLGDAWPIIDGEQYHYIIQPYTDAANLTEIEDELETRFGPLVDQQGHGFTGLRGTAATLTTAGNLRNSPHNTIVGAYDAPHGPEEWAAAWGAIASFYLNQDAARPLQFLKLKKILAPPAENRFTRSERDILLYDGIATWITDTSSNVLIERSITTYQTNLAGNPDPSYLDIQTLATLGEIRFQYKTRMQNRFIIPRFKLADDGYPVQPGTKVVTPKTVAGETIALFTDLRDAGLIENLDEFIENLIVERNATDQNRVDALIPPDLINQFRILSGLIQFIL